MSTIIAGTFIKADGWWRLERDTATGVFSIVKLDNNTAINIDRSHAIDYYRMIREWDRYPSGHQIFDEPPGGAANTRTTVIS